MKIIFIKSGVYSLYNFQQQGFPVVGSELSAVAENVQNSCLDREKVLILHLRTVVPHKFCKADQVLNIVAGVASADGNLGGNLPVRGRPEVDGVVRCGDVNKGQHWTVTVFRNEFHHLCYVPALDNLSHV